MCWVREFGECTGDSKKRRCYESLIVVLVLYLVLGVASAAIVPPWETPDAPSHYIYIRHLFLNRRLPLPMDQDQGLPYPAVLYEWHHPPLYYVTQVFLLRLAGARVPSVHLAFPQLSESFSFAEPSSRYVLSQWPWWTESPAYGTLLGLRLSGLILFGLPCLLIAGWTGWRLTGLVEFGAVMAAVVGLLPQHLFVQVSVENDGMAVLWATGVWCIILLALASPNTLRWYHIVAVGAMTGLGLLSKITVLPLLPVVLAWGVWCVRRVGMWNALLSLLVPFGMTMGLYVAFGFDHSVELYAHLVEVVSRSDQRDWLRFAHLASDSFWGRFGWMNVSLSPWLSTLMSVGSGVGILWTGAALARKRCPTEWVGLRAAFWWALGGLIAHLCFFFRSFLPIFQPQGRFLFPALLPFFLLASSGYCSTAKFFRRWGYAGVVVFLASLNVIALVRLCLVYWWK